MNPGDLIKYINKPSNPTIPYKQDMSVEGFFRSWVNSPEYKRRLIENQYNNPEQIILNRNSALDNLVFGFDESLPTQASAPINPRSESFVNINPRDYDKASPQTLKAHEISHVVGSTPGYENQNIGFNPIEQDLIKQYRTNPSSNTHDMMPKELKADMDAVRYNLFQKGLYDITSGNPFTKEDFQKALPSLKEDTSFKRLFDQTGEENFIEMMNTIAMNNQSNMNMAAYGGMINPLQTEYSLGGILGGALKGGLGGASLGVPGIIGGALLGGVSSFFKNRNQNKEEALLAEQQQQQLTDQSIQKGLSNMNAGMMNSSNLPMMYGGQKNYAVGGTLNPLTEFNVGGTHESNPNGGIPQGINSQGQQMTVEEGESKFRFKDGDYIFSNRLTL